MSKPRKKPGNPDFRHRSSVLAPKSEEIEARLFELVSPGAFTTLKGLKDKERSLRSRILTLPVMAAIVLTIVYRQVQHLTDVLRVLEFEGLMWVEATKISRQALSQRLNTLPADLFKVLFEQVVQQIAAKNRTIEDAFLLTKRLLGLSYLWVGGVNGIKMLSLCNLDFLYRT